VEAKPQEILFYECEDGRVPCREWLDSLEGRAIEDIVMTRLDRVERGNFGDHHSVGEGVMELVIDFGPGYRVYYGQDGKNLVILLIGGDKSSQRTDIKTAKGYWRNYNA
jgi:putative addiction module killer protein